MMASGKRIGKTTPDILRMDEKNIRQAEIIREDDMKTLLRSSNDDEEQHQNY